jgi:hypothetical protein
LQNTAIAQARLDQEYWDEQHEKWRAKVGLAEKRARLKIATDNPMLFLKVYVLPEGVGSLKRKRMLQLLRKYRPDMYDWWKQESGECLEGEGQDKVLVEDVEFGGGG